MSQAGRSQVRPGRRCGLHWMSLLLFLAAPSAWSDAVISGTVTNVLGQRVSGVRITISHRGQTIQEGVTDAGGAFSLEIDFGDAGNVNLVAEHPAYDPRPVTVRILNFEPTVDHYAVTLMPRELSACASTEGAFIVGKFLPPMSETSSDLTGYVHRVLSFRILTGLQIEQLRDQLDPEYRHLVPQFLKCEGANPRAEVQGKIIAQALGAQGLVWGVVADGEPGFDIDASVADAVDVFNPSFTTTSRDVDLGRPREAVISPMMRVAVLLAVMANLEKADQCQAAIHVSNVVRTLIPGEPMEADWQVLVTADKGIRERCQRRIPDAALVAGGP